MKCLTIIFSGVLFLFTNTLSAQKVLTIENFQSNQDIRWGSVSAQEPNYGFYGNEFEFDKDVKIVSVSVFIYDHKDYDEKKATVNFAIWGFEEKPTNELFISDEVQVLENEINNWKTYQFQEPLRLKKGEYLFAIGQSKIQGFVGFGNGTKIEGYSSGMWMKSSMGFYSNGKKWINLIEIMESQNSMEAQIESLKKGCVMMKVNVIY